MPARHLGVNALDALVAAGLWRSEVGGFAIELVAGANGNLWKVVEHVEFGDDQPCGAVDHVGVAEKRQVHPAAAAGASGDGAEFVAAFAQLVAQLSLVLRGEWASAHAGAISLGDADDGVDRSGRHAGP